MLVLAGMVSRGQNLDEIILLLKIGQFDKAKPDLDKYMSNAKNAAQATGWYYKAYAYSGLAAQPNKSIAEANQLSAEAFAAIKKYAEMDSKTPLAADEKNSTVFFLYNTQYDLGVKTFNTKDFAASYDFFRRTLDLHDYAYSRNLAASNGFKFPALDTGAVWNLALTARELKKKDELLELYKKVADADLSDEKYADAYDELMKKYRQEDNRELFLKYVRQAKKHYPTDPYWENNEIQYTLKGLDGEERFKAYEEMLAASPNNYMINFNYGLELERYIYTAEAKGKDLSGIKKKIPVLLKKALEIKPSFDGNMLLANHYYNSSFDILDEANKIKGPKPDDLKKKNDLKAAGNAMLLESQPYAEKAVELFDQMEEIKSSDKENCKQMLDILSTIWKQKGDLKKSEEYSKRKEQVDKR